MDNPKFVKISYTNVGNQTMVSSKERAVGWDKERTAMILRKTMSG